MWALGYCLWAFSSCREQKPLSLVAAVCGLLIEVGFLVTVCVSCCSSQAPDRLQ